MVQANIGNDIACMENMRRRDHINLVMAGLITHTRAPVGCSDRL